MHPHDRGGGATCCRNFSHTWLLNVAIVPLVRVSTVAMVLLKRAAVPKSAPNLCLAAAMSGKANVAGMMKVSM